MKERGWSETAVRLVAEKFKDHWSAQPGRAGSKLDWQATWRNWVRNEAAQKVEEPVRSSKPPDICVCCGAEASYSMMGKSYCTRHDKYSIPQAVAA
jgi:hypothetical protein